MIGMENYEPKEPDYYEMYLDQFLKEVQFHIMESRARGTGLEPKSVFNRGMESALIRVLEVYRSRRLCAQEDTRVLKKDLNEVLDNFPQNFNAVQEVEIDATRLAQLWEKKKV